MNTNLQKRSEAVDDAGDENTGISRGRREALARLGKLAYAAPVTIGLLSLDAKAQPSV